MLALVEDWARSLPQPQFGAALSMALEAGAQVPQRAEQDKAPLFDADSYELQRREQLAAQHTLLQRQQQQEQEQQRLSASRSARQGEYAAIGETPARAHQVRQRLRPCPCSRHLQRNFGKCAQHSASKATVSMRASRTTHSGVSVSQCDSVIEPTRLSNEQRVCSL